MGFLRCFFLGFLGGFFIANPANRKVKSGKFDCRVESLSVLLDYRWDIKKKIFLNIVILKKNVQIYQRCSMVLLKKFLLYIQDPTIGH